MSHLEVFAVVTFYFAVLAVLFQAASQYEDARIKLTSMIAAWFVLFVPAILGFVSHTLRKPVGIAFKTHLVLSALILLIATIAIALSIIGATV